MWRKKKPVPNYHSSFRRANPAKQTKYEGQTTINISKLIRFRDLEIGRRYDTNFLNPTHVEPYLIPELYYRFKTDGSIMITPKADGLPRVLELTFNNRNFIALHVEMVSNIYYIIDILESSEFDTLDMDFSTRLDYLSKILQINMTYLIHYSSNVNFWNDLHLITDSIEYIDLDNSTKLSVKPVICINFDSCLRVVTIDNSHPMNQINMLTKNSKVDIKIDSNFGNLCSTLLLPYVTTENSEKIYPNDGWIVYRSNSLTPVKFKPIQHLSLDIKLESKSKWTVDMIPSSSSFELDNVIVRDGLNKLAIGAIYRCIPVETPLDGFKWMVVDARPDKLAPNRYHHLQNLESRWRLEKERGLFDCENMVERYENDRLTYYYEIFEDDRAIPIDRDSRSTYQIIQANRVEKIMSYMIERYPIKDDNCIRVIDIGSGRCNMYAKVMRSAKTIYNDMFMDDPPYIEYYGIDTDPITLARGIERHASIIKIWGTMNGREGIEEYYSTHLNRTFNFSIVTLVNSINYSKNLIKLFQSIMTKVESGFIIVFSMFSDLIESKFDPNADPSLSIERIDENNGNNDKNNFRFTYPWRNESFVERIYSTTEFESIIPKIIGLKIDPITDELESENFNAVDLDQIGIERSFWEIHKCYVLKIR